MRKILALVFLLALPAVSWGASAESITIHVNGTESIPTMEPEVVKEYVPAVMSGDEEISPEEIGEVMFPALSGTNYTFETVPNALDFTISPRNYINDNYRGIYFGNPSYDITYDPSFPEAAGRPISTTAEYAIETGSIVATVDLADYSAVTDITFTASPRSITAPYGSRHFIAGGTSNVTFRNITFNGDDTGGGVTVSSGTVTFTGCTFNRCDTSGNGGGVEITGGAVVLTSPTFSWCNAGARGGAISISDGSATLTGASFSNCTAADYGGAVSVNGGTASITGTFNKNSSYSGGAVSVTGGSITLSEASFTDNDATNNGGAIYSSSGLTLGANVTFNTISDSAPNKATNGGALYIASGTSNISGSRVEFTENKAEYGGGIYIASGTVNVTGESVTFSGNTVSEDGGAIWAGSGSRVNLTGTSLSISNNQATSGDGGGIYASGNSTVTLEATSLGSNQAEIGRGGAVFMAGGSTLNISGAVSLASNRANFGGAIYMANARNSTNLNINGSDAVTFTNNDAQTSGGGIYAEANCVITLEPELTFSGNYARNGNGGALWVTDASQLPEGTVISTHRL